MANFLGVSKPTVGGWEARGLAPAPESLPRVVRFLGYEPGMPSPTGVVQQLTALRRRLRLGRAAMAERLGVSYAALWAWETGVRRPRGRSLVLLAAFLRAQDSEPVET